MRPANHAGVAQLAEQRICNPKVRGSSPRTGPTEGWQSGWMQRSWKSPVVVLQRRVGWNPTASTLYFVIKLILKSRNIYYTTIRMLGSPKKVARQLLIIELFIVANIAYFAFDCLIYLNGIGTIKNSILQTINEYLSFNDYILIYLILVFLSFLISEKYAAKIFKKSVMNSYREEV